MLPLIGLAAQFVPELIRIIAGDKVGSVAQTVSQTVAEITGTTDPVAAKQMLEADSAAAAALQQKLAEIALEATKAQLADAEQQRRAELAAIKAGNENTAGARSTLQTLASAGSPIAWGSPAVSVVVTVGFFVILALILFNGIPGLKGATPDATVVNIINISVGVLGTAFATVVNFWLGSSSSSRNKDAQVVELQNSHVQQTDAMLKALQTAQDVHAQSTQLAFKTVENVAANVISSIGTSSDAAVVAPAQDQGNTVRLMGDTSGLATSASPDALAQEMSQLTATHKYFQDGVSWRLTKDGISIEGAPAIGSMGSPTTVTTIWTRYSDPCKAAAKEFGVPIELIIATIATESSGNPNARRPEPKLGTESIGLMQTLVTTARQVLGMRSLIPDDLLNPTTSIRAGAAYIAQQRVSTHFDPPLVAAAYNAGSLRREDADANRWRLVCYPSNTGTHVDRFVQWFNDAMGVGASQGWGSGTDVPSFSSFFKNP